MFSLSLLSAFFVFFTSVFKEKVYQMYSCHRCAMSYFSCCSNTSLPSPVIGSSWWPKAGDILLQWRDSRGFYCISALHRATQCKQRAARAEDLAPATARCGSVPQLLAVECRSVLLQLGRVAADWAWAARWYHRDVLQRVWWRYQHFASIHAVGLHVCLIPSLPDHCKGTAFFCFLPLRCCLCLFRAQWTFPIRFPFFRFQVCLSLKAGQVLGRAGMHRSIDFLPLGSLECFPGLAVALGCPAGQAN